MKTLACTLIIAAGLIVSFILITEEKEKISKVKCAVEFIALMKVQIENFKTPIGDIISMYLGTAERKQDVFFTESPERLPETLEEMVPDGGRTLWTVKEIMNGSYDDAVKGSAALESRAKELLEKNLRAFDERKRTLMILPPAACLLLVILIL